MSLERLPHWLSFHVFYHGDRDRLLRLLVEPLVTELRADGLFRRFFFIRYSLGGPHVRLRLEPALGDADSGAAALRDRVIEAAQAFFDRQPSQQSLDEEEIRRVNEQVLANDSGDDAGVFADNSIVEIPFDAEVARYGGRDRLDASLDLFELSSLAAFDFIAEHHDLPAKRQLPAALSILMHQAAGLATSLREMETISRYGEGWSPVYEPLLKRGDAAYEGNPRAFSTMLRYALTDDSQGAAYSLRRGSSVFAQALGHTPPGLEVSIKSSHLHMTANRLGLSNASEVYLGRILCRAVEDLRGSAPEIFPELGASAGTEEPVTG